MDSDNKVAVLDPWQVWDDSHRGCYFVGLEPSKGQRHKGRVVYVDKFGRRIVIRGAES